MINFKLGMHMTTPQISKEFLSMALALNKLGQTFLTILLSRSMSIRMSPSQSKLLKRQSKQTKYLNSSGVMT